MRDLLAACEAGALELATSILEEGDVGVNQASADGRLPLVVAAAAGHTLLVAELLGRGASLSACDGEGRTALWWACHNGHEQAAAVLLDCGSDAGALDEEGVSPLCAAVEGGQDGAVQLLLDRYDDGSGAGSGGAEAAPEGGGETVAALLEVAAARGHDDIEAALRRRLSGTWCPAVGVPSDEQRRLKRFKDCVHAAPLLAERVELVELQGEPALNGRLGIAAEWDAARGRYAVQLDHTGASSPQLRHLKPANVRRFEGGAGAGGALPAAGGAVEALAASEAAAAAVRHAFLGAHATLPAFDERGRDERGNVTWLRPPAWLSESGGPGADAVPPLSEEDIRYLASGGATAPRPAPPTAAPPSPDPAAHARRTLLDTAPPEISPTVSAHPSDGCEEDSANDQAALAVTTASVGVATSDEAAAPSDDDEGAATSDDDEAAAPSDDDEGVAPSDDDEAAAPSDDDEAAAPSGTAAKAQKRQRVDTLVEATPGIGPDHASYKGSLLPCPKKVPYDLNIGDEIAVYFKEPHNDWFRGRVTGTDWRPKAARKNVTAEFDDGTCSLKLSRRNYGADMMWVLPAPGAAVEVASPSKAGISPSAQTRKRRAECEAPSGGAKALRRGGSGTQFGASSTARALPRGAAASQVPPSTKLAAKAQAGGKGGARSTRDRQPSEKARALKDLEPAGTLPAPLAKEGGPGKQQQPAWPRKVQGGGAVDGGAVDVGERASRVRQRRA